MEKQKRVFGIDLVRVVAICFLFWLHFWYRNGFYYKPVNQLGMILAAQSRCLFMCCVTLFMMLTGYLKCEKSFSKSHFRAIIPILISWFLISWICVAERILYYREEKTVLEWILEVLDFKGADYSWYIEMYIGLFLLIPFFNMGWDKLETKKNHQRFLLLLLFMTVFPDTINKIGKVGETEVHLLPNYWTYLWPFTYYFIGVYIRKYSPKPPKWLCISVILVVTLILAGVNMISGGFQGGFAKGFMAGYSHLATVILSVSVFLLCYRVECRWKFVSGCMKTVSSVTLEMYLISVVFDKPIYGWESGLYGAEKYLQRGLIMCSMVFICSFAAGGIVHLISRGITKGVSRGLQEVSK